VNERPPAHGISVGIVLKDETWTRTLVIMPSGIAGTEDSQED
jgi:hypothetical protein